MSAAAKGRHLIYLIGVGEMFRRYAAMTLTSIRQIGGWTGDIVLLSDSEIPIRGFPDVRTFDALSAAKARYSWYKGDKRAITHLKTELEHHVDTAAYDYILYLDSDVLVTSDRLPSLVAAWREEEAIVVQQDIIAISSGFRFAGRNTLTEDERRRWGHFAINAGIVGLPATPMGRRVFRDWRAFNVEQRFAFSDQGTLLAVLLRKYYGQWGYVADAVIGRQLARYPETFVHFTSRKDELMENYFFGTLGLSLPE